jgi:hypothetical protein
MTGTCVELRPQHGDPSAVAVEAKHVVVAQRGFRNHDFASDCGIKLEVILNKKILGKTYGTWFTALFPKDPIK